MREENQIREKGGGIESNFTEEYTPLDTTPAGPTFDRSESDNGSETQNIEHYDLNESTGTDGFIDDGILECENLILADYCIDGCCCYDCVAEGSYFEHENGGYFQYDHENGTCTQAVDDGQVVGVENGYQVDEVFDTGDGYYANDYEAVGDFDESFDDYEEYG